MCQQHQIIINAYETAFQVMQDRIAELEKRVQELEPVIRDECVVPEPVIRDECVVPEFAEQLTEQQEHEEKIFCFNHRVRMARTTFSTKPRFFGNNSVERVNGRLSLNGSMKPLKHIKNDNDGKGEYFKIRKEKVYASKYSDDEELVLYIQTFNAPQTVPFTELSESIRFEMGTLINKMDGLLSTLPLKKKKKTLIQLMNKRKIFSEKELHHIVRGGFQKIGTPDDADFYFRLVTPLRPVPVTK